MLLYVIANWEGWGRDESTYQCGPGSNPRSNAICGLGLLFVPPMEFRFSSPQNQHFPSNKTWEMVERSQSVDSLRLLIYLVIYLLSFISLFIYVLIYICISKILLSWADISNHYVATRNWITWDLEKKKLNNILVLWKITQGNTERNKMVWEEGV